MSDQDDTDTPPPYKSKSDANIQLPIDPQWFHEFRHETTKGISAIRKDMNTLETRLNDARLSASKHDDQISQLATDLAETDRNVAVVGTRVKILEDSDGVRSNREAFIEKSIISKIKETVIITAVGGLVGGAGMFIWYLVTLFVKAAKE